MIGWDVGDVEVDARFGCDLDACNLLLCCCKVRLGRERLLFMDCSFSDDSAGSSEYSEYSSSSSLSLLSLLLLL